MTQPVMTAGQQREMAVTRHLDVPREELWRAWTDPEQLRKWIGPRQFTVFHAEMDVRKGGAYQLGFRSPDGREFWIAGAFLDIVPLQRLVLSASFTAGTVRDTSTRRDALDLRAAPLNRLTVTFEDHHMDTPGHERHTMLTLAIEDTASISESMLGGLTAMMKDSLGRLEEAYGPQGPTQSNPQDRTEPDLHGMHTGQAGHDGHDGHAPMAHGADSSHDQHDMHAAHVEHDVHTDDVERDVHAGHVKPDVHAGHVERDVHAGHAKPDVHAAHLSHAAMAHGAALDMGAKHPARPAAHEGHAEPAAHEGHAEPEAHEGHATMAHGGGEHDMHAGQGGLSHHAMMVADFRRRFFVSLILMVPILALSPMIQMFLGVDWRFPGDSWLLTGLSTVLFVYGGKPFLVGAVDELRQKSPAMMTLIALAITVAYVYSTLTVFVLQGSDFFWELATLIVIMLLGHWIEMRSVMGASRALDELVKLMPETAHVLQDDGTTRDVAVAELQTGARLLVKPGEKIPIDGQVFDGRSAVNEAMVTGEAVPVEKLAGDELIGGSINGEGVLRFTVSRVGEATFLSQVIRMVREAQESKSHTQRLADIAARWLFFIAIAAGTLTFAGWMLAGRGLEFAVERAVTVIVISCPHALGLAIPLVTAISTSIGASRGLLIRDRTAFENARLLDAVVFDKTGTLTQAQFGLTDVIPVAASEEELLTLAYSVESSSEHPIAQGIVRAGQERGLKLLPVSDYRNLTGQGLEATADGREIRIVSPGTLRGEGISFDEAAFGQLAESGKTVVFVVEDGRLLGALALADLVRESARQAVQELKEMQVESIMLTGDNRRAAAYIGKQVHIDDVIAEVLPQDKADKIAELQRSGRRVAMTGDGVNDAPSLAKADLGIAIGAGTDVAIETADVVLVRSDPRDVVSILKLSRATYRKMVQNLAWATVYNVVALPLAAGVLYNQGIVITPALGAVFMSLSTIIVAINARLLRIPEVEEFGHSTGGSEAQPQRSGT